MKIGMRTFVCENYFLCDVKFLSFMHTEQVFISIVFQKVFVSYIKWYKLKEDIIFFDNIIPLNYMCIYT